VQVIVPTEEDAAQAVVHELCRMLAEGALFPRDPELFGKLVSAWSPSDGHVPQALPQHPDLSGDASGRQLLAIFVFLSLLFAICAGSIWCLASVGMFLTRMQGTNLCTQVLPFQEPASNGIRQMPWQQVLERHSPSRQSAFSAVLPHVAGTESALKANCLNDAGMPLQEPGKERQFPLIDNYMGCSAKAAAAAVVAASSAATTNPEPLAELDSLNFQVHLHATSCSEQELHLEPPQLQPQWQPQPHHNFCSSTERRLLSPLRRPLVLSAETGDPDILAEQGAWSPRAPTSWSIVALPGQLQDALGQQFEHASPRCV